MPTDAEGFERLFLALVLGEPLGASAARAVRSALDLPAHRAPPAGLRLYAPGDLHLTLFFLGNVACARRGELERGFAQAFEGLRAPALVLGPAGAFPDPSRPRILWLGAREPRPGALAALEVAARTAAVGLGFRPDERPFRPHVTVARVKPSRAAQPGRRRVVPVPGAFFELDPRIEWEPASVSLVRTVGAGSGGVYRVERAFSLARP